MLVKYFCSKLSDIYSLTDHSQSKYSLYNLQLNKYCVEHVVGISYPLAAVFVLKRMSGRAH
jgi:hypothetical protein